jgi:hypothetical protein
MSKPKLGSGARFAKMKSDIKSSHVARGRSAAEADKIAAATAAKIGRAKYGKARFAKLSAAGRRRHAA